MNDLAHDRALVQQVRQRYVLPDYVNIDELLTKQAAETLPLTAFADPSERKLPIATKADTWMSMAVASLSPRPKDRYKSILKRAADLWQISEQDLPEQEHLRKQASATCTLLIKSAGEVLDTIDIYRPDDLHAAAKGLLMRRTKFPYDARAGLAEQLLKHAAEHRSMFDEPTTQILERMAGYGSNTAPAVANFLSKRASLYAAPRFHHYARNLRLVASRIGEGGSDRLMAPEYLRKVAYVVDLADRAVSIYDKRTDCDYPEDVLFARTMGEAVRKLASEVQLRDNFVIKKASLAERYEPVANALEDMTGTRPADIDALAPAIRALTPIQWSKVKSLVA